MTGTLEHRGPDACGYYNDRFAYLGHRRLSIVDLATGQQPMPNEDESLWTIHNGEIFNHSNLRPELEAFGHRYRTRSDTEAILHGYEEFGPACVTRFNGMFAFAVWDQRSRQLFCARDRHGIKPFYYYWDDQLFAFASEIKALLEHPSISRRLNEGVLQEYFAFGYVGSDETLFAGIRKLPPASYLVVDYSGDRPSLRLRQYWEAPLLAEPEPWREQDAIAECRRRLTECVRSRLMADVPLGLFLSGGLDSSAIAAIMKRECTGPLRTFAVGYQEAECSESGWARQVAAHMGSEHHNIVVGFDEFFSALPKLAWHEDEPICFSSSIPLYYLSRLARQHVKVVLTGEGSDELFAGYERYRYHLINEQALRYYGVLPSTLRAMFRGLLDTRAVPSMSLRRKLQHTFLYRKPSIESLYLDNFCCGFTPYQLDYMARGALKTAPSPYASFLEHWKAEPQQSTLARLLFSDQKTYLVELLMKQDQMSMAASVESRVPFLDHTFVEFAMRLPDSLKLPSRGKYILKKAVEDLLPRQVVNRAKMGFPTPVRRWLAEPKSDVLLQYINDPAGLLADYFDPVKLRSLTDRHRAGTEDATDRIWRLLNFQVWGDLFFTGRRVTWMGEDLGTGAIRREPAAVAMAASAGSR